MADTERMRAEFEAVAGRLDWTHQIALAWQIWQAACRSQAKRDAEISRRIGRTFAEHPEMAETIAEAIEQERKT